MTNLLPALVRRTASLGCVLMLSLPALACDSGDDTAGDETSGDGDGDPSTGDGDGDPSTGDGDGDGDPGTLSYAADIQPIFDANCVSACHTAGGVAAMTLILDGDSYTSVVGATSTQAAGVKLVDPGSSADSYLVAKLRGTQVAAGGNGGRMPSVPADPLDDATIMMIESWIDLGAAP